MSAPLRVVAVVGTTRSVSKTKALAELIIGGWPRTRRSRPRLSRSTRSTHGLGTAVEREQHLLAAARARPAAAAS
jgi:hypothetical protein